MSQDPDDKSQVDGDPNEMTFKAGDDDDITRAAGDDQKVDYDDDEPLSDKDRKQTPEGYAVEKSRLFDEEHTKSQPNELQTLNKSNSNQLQL